MSKYTTEVRYICETSAGLHESEGQMSINDILKKAAPKIFNFDFPIFDEAYRLPLEIKILKHYYTREIGAETVGLWKLWLDQRMNEIMPLYNEKYKLKAEALKERAKLFDNVDLKTTRKTDDESNVKNQGNTTGRSDSTSKNDYTNLAQNSSEHKDAYSDTPQGSLHGVDSLTYLTDYRKITDNGNDKLTHAETGTDTVNNSTQNTSNTDMVSTQDFIEHITGKNGGENYLKLYADAYNSLVNIDMEIIDELSDLFFGLW